MQMHVNSLYLIKYYEDIGDISQNIVLFHAWISHLGDIILKTIPRQTYQTSKDSFSLNANILN